MVNVYCNVIYIKAFTYTYVGLLHTFVVDNELRLLIINDDFDEHAQLNMLSISYYVSTAFIKNI